VEGYDDPRSFRAKKEFISLIRNIRLQKNEGKMVETMEDLILRMDLFVEGFETIKGVAIELSGCRSYIMVPSDNNEGLITVDRKGKRVKQKLAIVVNVRP
jgi:hypothetical protein